MGPRRNLSALNRQAEICRHMGSPFAARVLDAAARVLDDRTATGAAILGWDGDPDRAAVALRLGAGLHAIARGDRCAALRALYRTREGQADDAVALAIAENDGWLADWLQSPPQTNEIGRAAAVMAALLTVAAHGGAKLELLELGSSAGLNLNLDLYAYDLGGTRVGDPLSPIVIRPDWRGRPPPAGPIDIVAKRGVDLAPLDSSNPATAERLTAFIWADRHERIARLEAAIELARSHPPPVDCGDAVPWLRNQLTRPQAPGVTRVVFHTIVLQYLSDAARAEVATLMAGAGEQATDDQPLACVAFEWDAGRGAVELSLRHWPGGEERLLATAHPHAEWIEWIG